MEAIRLKQVRERLDDWELDGLLVTNSFNRRYVTGFTGSAGYALITRERALLFTDFRYVRQAAAQAKEYETIRHAAIAGETIREALESLGVRRLGFEKNDLSYGAYTVWQDWFAGIELVPTCGIAETIRGLKDQMELSLIREAVAITERAFEHILNIIRPGVSEREISAELECFMRKNGAASSAYSSIVASGERSALPHGLASGKLIGANEFVTLDFGANYEGYCSDLTRTVFVGHPDERHKELYKIVLEANLTTLAGLTPGLSAKDADSLGRDVIAKYGYADYFGHGLGHAFGLEIHEAVRLSQTSGDVLQPGMVITVEPGIYIPGFGGVRIEDDVVMTDTGIEVLTKSNKELIVL